MSNKPAPKNVNPPVMYMADNWSLQMDSRLACPGCGTIARPYIAEYLNPGIAVDCPNCSNRLFDFRRNR
jgi:DNA-directed RNA polymerase subunit RPC12/RpoP